MKKHVTTEQGDIYYFADLEFPGRPTVVLLHGLSSNHTTWNAMVERLHNEKINSIAWDQRGHGLSDKRKRRSNYRWPVFSDDLFRILEAENIAHANFVGYSYGVPILMELAKNHADMLDGLVLISGNFTSPPVYMRLGLLTPLLYGLFQLGGWLLVPQFRKKYYYYKHGEASGYWQSTIRGLSTMPLSVNAWMFSLVFHMNYRRVLPTIKAPTVIVRADHDPFFSASEAADMAKTMPNARVVSPKHPSHFVASRSQDEISDLILSTV